MGMFDYFQCDVPLPSGVVHKSVGTHVTFLRRAERPPMPSGVEHPRT